MADISLRDYLDKLDSLLGTPDEVIHHCRHILQYFPKNVATYRYLGRALLSSAGLEEASEVFRRVLGVYPDDVAAHVSLSEVYQRTGKTNEALYHMERAFEQEPHNKTLIDNLRELYRKYRQEDFAKLQLTTGGVARQYVRNGLYSQAIDTLRSALDRSPNRQDLRLLLARTLWDSNLKIEAAEQALDVLKALPDCLEANRLMTQLWLEERRPSDAQRYLSHIEAVDPYLALQIAQDAPPPDNAFKLPEADYGSVQRRRLETAQPDWLSEIGQNDWDAPVAAGIAALPVDDEAITTAVPDDWLSEEEPEFDNLFADVENPPASMTGMLAALGQAPQEATEEPSFDFNFDDDLAEAAPASSDELPDWLTEAAPSMPIAQPTAEPEAEALDWLEDETLLDKPSSFDDLITAAPDRVIEENDPLAWMQGTDIEIVDEQPAAPALFGDLDEVMEYQNPGDTDPLAWLQGTDVEVVGEPENSLLMGDDEVNSLSWMQDADVELVDEPALSAPVSDENDPLAWLQGTDVELDDDQLVLDNLPTDWLRSAAPLETTTETASATQDDSLRWLQDDAILEEALDLEQLNYEQPLSISNLLQDPDAEPVDTAARYGQTDLFPGQQSTEANNPNWRSEMNDQELPDWLGAQSSDDSESESDPLSWMGEQPAAQPEDDDQALDWMMEVEDEEPASNAPLAATNPDWLIEETEVTEQPTSTAPEWLTAEPAEPAADSFEWLIEENEPAQPAASTAGFEWLSGEEPTKASNLDWMTEQEEQPTATSSDWLSASAIPEPEATPAESEFGWLGEQTEEPAAATGGFEWIAEETKQEEQPTATSSDWLSASAIPEPEATPAESEFGWLGEQSEEPGAATGGFEWIAEEPEGDQPAAVVPDWLTAAAPVMADEPDETPAASEFGWLAEEPEEEQPAATAGGFEWIAEEPKDDQPAAVVPDWLTAAAPVMADEPDETPAASEFGWLAEEPEEEAQPTASGFEWLSEEPAEEQAAAGFEWMAEEPEEEPATVVPDWLTAAAPVMANEPDETPAASEFGWLAEEPEEEAQPTASGFEWMAEEPEAEEQPAASGFEWLSSEADEEPAVETASGFDWMAEEPEEEQPAAVVPDWLTAAAPVMEDDEEPVATESSFEWMAEEPEEEQPAAVVPDWLTAAAPVMEADEEPVATSSEFGWISEEDEEAAAEPAVDIPDWMATSQPIAEEELEAEEEAFSWTPDTSNEPSWLSELAEAEAEEEKPAEVASNLPDWLGTPTEEVEEQAELQSIQSLDWGVTDEATSDEFALQEEGYDEDEYAEPAVDMPDWLSGVQPETDAFAAEATMWNDEELTPESTFDDDERLLATASAPPPASNAPDWLNAMVPGLDLDYEATEVDKPVEREFNTPAAQAQPSGFDWLVRIVEEETGPIKAIRETVAAVRRRFTFQRQPAWLRVPMETSGQPLPTSEAQSAAEADDDDDFDLPDWLK